MARLGRYFTPDQPLHVIQRGNDRKAVFFADAGPRGSGAANAVVRPGGRTGMFLGSQASL